MSKKAWRIIIILFVLITIILATLSIVINIKDKENQTYRETAELIGEENSRYLSNYLLSNYDVFVEFSKYAIENNTIERNDDNIEMFNSLLGNSAYGEFEYIGFDMIDDIKVIRFHRSDYYKQFKITNEIVYFDSSDTYTKEGYSNIKNQFYSFCNIMVSPTG